MKQLSVFCSPDLEDRVVSAFDRAGVEGFMRLPGASAHLFAEPGQVPRTIDWEAVLLIVPAAPGERLERVLDELETYTRQCDTGVCIRHSLMEVAGKAPASARDAE